MATRVFSSHLFSIDTRVNYFLFKISLNRTVGSGVITDSLSCLAEHLCNWFCKYFSIITTTVYISLDYSVKGTKLFDILTGDQELEIRTAKYIDPKLTNHSAQNALDTHTRFKFITVHSLEKRQQKYNY